MEFKLGDHFLPDSLGEQLLSMSLQFLLGGLVAEFQAEVFGEKGGGSFR